MIKKQIFILDKDECATDQCSDNCTENAPGQGYTCSCPPGKKLDIDQRTCIGNYRNNVDNNICCEILGSPISCSLMNKSFN